MYEDFYPHFGKEHDCFKGVLAGNISKADFKKTPNAADWPYNQGPRGDVTEDSYRSWLDKCLDPDKQEYYLAKDEKTGLPIKGTEPRYRVSTIVRMKTAEDSQRGVASQEILLSKGSVLGHDSNGDEHQFPIKYPEMWYKSNFKFETRYDEKRKGMVKQCLGPSRIDKIYELKFNEKNAKMLLDKRISDKIQFVVKDEANQRAVQVEPDVNLPKTFERFLKPFDYLFTGNYISPQQKAEARARAVAEGLIAGTPSEVSNVPSNPPPKGAYT